MIVVLAVLKILRCSHAGIKIYCILTIIVMVHIRPSKVDSLIPVSFLAGINAGGRSLFIIHYHDLIKIN